MCVRPWKLPLNTMVLRPLGDLLGQLDRRLGDLGAGVGEEERVDRRRRQLAELGGERLEQIVLVDVDLRVDEPLGLLADRLGDVRMGVAGGVDRDARGEVEVLLAVGRGDPAPFAAGNLQRGHREPDVGQMGLGTVGHACHARDVTPRTQRPRTSE